MLKLIKIISAGRSRGLFECYCGNTFVTYTYNVKNGHTKSCGCLTRSMGLTKDPIYRTFMNIKTRCSNKNTPYYRLYGGRGIKCLFKSSEHLKAVIGPHPGKGWSVDRIDVNGNYEPGNCRWTTQLVQQNNRRNNHVLASGRTISQEARSIGLKPNTLYYRIKRKKRHKCLTLDEAFGCHRCNPKGA